MPAVGSGRGANVSQAVAGHGGGGEAVGDLTGAVLKEEPVTDVSLHGKPPGESDPGRVLVVALTGCLRLVSAGACLDDGGSDGPKATLLSPGRCGAGGHPVGVMPSIVPTAGS